MNSIADNIVQQLITAAQGVNRNAYAPYSRFRVGAAVLSANGQIFTGCNVENASYGLTCCAERNAIFQMIAGGETEFTFIVVYTPTPTPTAPCGACRQVLNEFSPEATLLCICDGSESIRTSVRELLPMAFGPHQLPQ